MLNHALRKPDAWTSPGLLKALGNTLTVGGIAAILTVGAALFLVYGVRLAGRGLPRLVLPLTLLAMPRRGRCWRWGF